MHNYSHISKDITSIQTVHNVAVSLTNALTTKLPQCRLTFQSILIDTSAWMTFSRSLSWCFSSSSFFCLLANPISTNCSIGDAWVVSWLLGMSASGGVHWDVWGTQAGWDGVHWFPGGVQFSSVGAQVLSFGVHLLSDGTY